MIIKAINRNKNKIKHIYTFDQVQRRGGKYIENVLVDDSKQTKLKLKINKDRKDNSKLNKKDELGGRINAPYMFGREFITSINEGQVHS